MYLTSRKADIVISDEPSTSKASHPFAASIALLALSFGTLSPKKTTFKDSNTSEKWNLFYSYALICTKFITAYRIYSTNVIRDNIDTNPKETN